MDIWILFLFVGTELMFSLSPGPAVAAVVSSSIVGGYRLAIYAILGVLVGNLIYFIASACIILAGTSIDSDYFLYIKIAGCMYLAWILFHEYLFRYLNPSRHLHGTDPVNDGIPNGGNRFILTLVMQLANPKTIIFFTAFLPQFIDLEQDLVVQFSTLAVLSMATEFAVLMGYAAGGQILLKYGSEKFGQYAHHAGNMLMAAAVVWSLFR